VSNGRQLQWCVYPLNKTGEVTNWSHELPADTWWHVAVVDNPVEPVIGLTQLNLPWVLGGYDCGGSINQIRYGWIGDVRIVDRALPVEQFMLNR
jgi:hypothetical protein